MQKPRHACPFNGYTVGTVSLVSSVRKSTVAAGRAAWETAIVRSPLELIVKPLESFGVIMDQQDVGLTYQGKPRTWGVRFSFFDAVILVAAVVAGIGSYAITDGYSLLILFVVFHFFLFCNVFRIRRKPELVWAGIFVLNCTAWTQFGGVSLVGMIGSQFFVTVLVIANEFRSPNYHGVFARRINSRLDDYLSGKIR